MHKQSGQAIVTLPDRLGGRRDVLFGTYNTPQSRGEYARVIAQWEADGRRLTTKTDDIGTRSLNELIFSYWPAGQTYYRDAVGNATSEANNIRLALRRLKEPHGRALVVEFDSMALKALRLRMIGEGLCRSRMNRDVARVKRLFKWGASRKLVPLTVHQSLQTVDGLRAGRSDAKERPPVLPVAESCVRATLPFLSRQMSALVEMQLHTGMRPGEAVAMRTMDLDTAGKFGFINEEATEGRESIRPRTEFINAPSISVPGAQAVLHPWLRLNLVEYLFQPREARAEWQAEKRKARRSKVTLS